MKPVIIFLLIFVLGDIAYSQTEIELKDIQIPNSPAFILLDVAPTSIERPTSTKAFGTSILNNLNSSQGIPENYAFEVTPFWFYKRKNMTAYQYWGYDTDKNKQKIFSSLKEYSTSFALVQKEPIDSLSTNNQMNTALGFRATIIKIHSEKNIEALKKANADLVSKLRDINDKLAQIKTDIVLAEGELEEASSDSVRILLSRELKKLEDSYSKLLGETENNKDLIKLETEISEILKRKPLFAIDGATGINWAFDDADYSSNRFSRYGAWLTLSFTPKLSEEKSDFLNIYAIGRYISDNNLKNENDDFEKHDIFDSGGKLEFEFDKLTFSYEYVYRKDFNDDINSSFRSSGLIKYQISDKLYLTGALGKNFGNTDNLITQFGINWGIGTGNENVLSE